MPELGRFYSHLHRVGKRIFLRKIGRNDPCPCGSGLKSKKCCVGFDAPFFIKVMTSINDFPLTLCEKCHIKSGLLKTS